jgi:DNA-directed RNA polymerase subunit RPC12/RpoP
MAELFEYKCPNCGGAIEFDTASQKMKCPYCDSEFDVEALKNLDNRLSEQKPDEFTWEKGGQKNWDENEEEKMCLFVCKSCGGEIVADENTAATECPYCNNPVVMSGRLSGTLKPDYVIPFKLDKNMAKQTLKAYTKKKRFAPNLFKTENKLEEIKGIYVPFWLFDSDATANVNFKATRTTHWSDKKYRYTKTDYFDVFRSGNMRFQNIPVDGSSKMADDLMESIEPFDFGEAVDFQTAYLSGFLADKYDVSMENSIERANQRIKSSCEETLRTTVSGFETVSTEGSSVWVSNGVAKYALYPVWIMNTVYKGERLTFAMNGQTGKLVGNIPVSKAKLAALFAALSIIGTPIITLIVGLIGLFD